MRFSKAMAIGAFFLCAGHAHTASSYLFDPSPRKMRLVADMIRGMEVNRALGVLKFSSKEAAARVEKLLRSAIANWEQKNERKAESGELFVTQIFVDGGATLKRMRPAPQGRGYRIRKRSNHVTLFVGAKSNNEDQN